MHVDWDRIIDTIQAGLVGFIIIVVTLCTATLILFDVLAGTGVDMFLTQGRLLVSIVISMATTGLLMALMFVGYSLVDKKGMNKSGKTIGWVVLFFAGAVFLLDVIFDSLSADVLSYGKIVTLSETTNENVHLMFRVLIGGISVVGEALAVAIIMGMPMLKGIINNALPPQYQSTQRNQTYRAPQSNQYRYDASRPVYSNIPKQTLVPASQIKRPAPRTQASFAPEPRYPTYHPMTLLDLNAEDEDNAKQAEA